MRALPENIASGQSNDRACEVFVDQWQYFQVKPEPSWLLLYHDKYNCLFLLIISNVLSFYLFIVYCTGLLGSNVVGLLHPCLTHLLFYVSVCSLAPLNHLDAYVACKYS